jgi:glycerophosphoryl diester phosphodiesterase
MLDLNFGTFNPEFWAREYYENLTNKIDIFIETEIEKELQKSEAADVKKIDYYNELRNEFLNEIQNVEAENLKQIKLDMNEIQHKLDAAAKMNSQQILNQCIGEIKVNIVFKKFCFLIKNIEKNHVCLISTDFYVTDDEIEYLK